MPTSGGPKAEMKKKKMAKKGGRKEAKAEIVVKTEQEEGEGSMAERRFVLCPNSP